MKCEHIVDKSKFNKSEFNNSAQKEWKTDIDYIILEKHAPPSRACKYILHARSASVLVDKRFSNAL
jgi:hypothetical protein